MPSKPKLTEKQFQAQVVALAKLCGWKCYHTHNSRHSAPGFPDLVLARRGQIVMAELKVGKNKPSAAQRDWLAELALCPVIARLWYPEDWKEIEAILTGKVGKS